MKPGYPAPVELTIATQFSSAPGLLPRNIEFTANYIPTEDNTGPDSMLFLGMGNEGPAARQAAQALSKLGMTGVVMVEALPYHRTDPTEFGVKSLAQAASKASIEAVHELNGDSTDPIHAGAESQAGPSLAWTAAEHPELYTGRLALVRALGVHKAMSKPVFVARMLCSGFQKDQLTPRTLPIAGRAGWRAAQDAIHNRGHMLRVALGIDTLDALTVIARKRPNDVRVFTAVKDLLFPPSETHARLKEADLENIHTVLLGSHSSPALPAGARQVATVTHWQRTGELLAV